MAGAAVLPRLEDDRDVPRREDDAAVPRGAASAVALERAELVLGLVNTADAADELKRVYHSGRTTQ